MKEILGLNYNTMKTRTHVLVLAAVMSLSSCSKILLADFERDAVGSQPDKSLPGGPSGDEITYHSDLAYRMRVRDSPEGMTGKSLYYSGMRWDDASDIALSQRWLTFHGTSVRSTRPLVFVWQGRFSNFKRDSDQLLVDITGGSVTPMVRLEIHNDGRVLAIPDFQGSTPQVLGTIDRGAPHTFAVSVNPETRRYSVLIGGGRRGSSIQRDDLPFLSDGQDIPWSAPFRPAISFKLSEGVGSESHYVLGELSVGQSNP